MRRLAVLVLLGTGTALAKDAFEAARDRYEEAMRRPPLNTRLGGFRALASTGDPRALALLAARYDKPAFPKDHEQYLIARLCGDSFQKPEQIPEFWKWAERERQPADAWLRFHASRGAARPTPLDERLETLLLDPRASPFHRAATLEAWAEAKNAAALDRLPEWLASGSMPSGGLPLGLLLESAASLLLAHRDQLGKKPFENACLALVDRLEAKETPERTRLVLARHFAKSFGTETIALKAIYWRQLLAYQQVKDYSGTTGEGRPRFFGVEGSGDRVVFLIDLSDSMLEPLTEAELAEAKRLGLPVEDRTKNRFDLARGCLAESLLALDPKIHFAVIGFGDRAELFRATHEMTRASKRNVREAVRELQGIEPRKPSKDRPYGSLRGATNLHGAILLAFRLSREGLSREAEHVDPAGIESGADTIFLLSDGAPTCDDFAAQDEFRGGSITKDTETGEVDDRAPPGSASFYGPYRFEESLLRDVQRMNLFRKAEIHCIGIGEADGKLLRRIADLGLGRYRSIAIAEAKAK